MKFLLFILGCLIFVGYLITQQKVRANVENAVKEQNVVIGMTQADAKRSLGEPLSVRKVQGIFGSTVAMTFSDGNEVTFTGDRATKIETVKLSKELSDLKKAAAAQKEYGGPNNAGIPPKSPLGWKSQFGGTALDRRPYTKYNGHIYYSDTDDPDKLGTATESSKRNGLYRDK